MELTTPILFEQTCRTCSVRKPRVRSLREYANLILSISEMLQTVAPQLVIETGDGLPESICAVCYNKLLIAYSFQQMCLKSDKKLRLMMTQNVKQEHTEVQQSQPMVELCIPIPMVENKFADCIETISINDDDMEIINAITVNNEHQTTEENISNTASNAETQSCSMENLSDVAEVGSNAESESDIFHLQVSLDKDNSNASSEIDEISLNDTANETCADTETNSNNKSQNPPKSVNRSKRKFLVGLLDPFNNISSKKNDMPFTRNRRKTLEQIPYSLRRHSVSNTENYASECYWQTVSSITDETTHKQEECKGEIRPGMHILTCFMCDITFCCLKLFKIHKVKHHHGYHPYSCKYCKKKLANNYNLKVHLLNHRLLRCDLCRYEFPEIDLFLKHKAKNHRLKCPHCPLSFVRKLELRRHFLKHNHSHMNKEINHNKPQRTNTETVNN